MNHCYRFEIIGINVGQDGSKIVVIGLRIRSTCHKRNRTVGNGKHLKVTFTNLQKDIVIDGIGFDLASKINLLTNKRVACAFQLVINKWNSKVSPQLQIVDIKTYGNK